MHNTNQPSRRDFLKGSSAAVAAASLAGGLSVARSAQAAGSDELKIALIGCGGRGTGAANDCLSANKDVKLVALADTFADRTERALKNLKAAHAARVDVPADRVFVGFDAYQKAIDCGVDIVLLATPPGFRPLQYAAAVKAGKHVFMEKPCCVDAPGFKTLMAANKLADEKGLKVAAGLQRRHSREYIPKIGRIHDGVVGDLILVRVYWNGAYAAGGYGRKPAGMSEMEFQIRNWNAFRWLSGDHIVEQHVHNLDVANWAKDAHPVEANGMGGQQVRKRAQIYDHHFVEFTYADGSKLYSQCRQMPGCWNPVTEFVHGTKGTMQLGGNGSDGYRGEHADLVRAIRSGEKLNDGWHGATSSMTAVLGRMATYSGNVVKWDDAVEKGPSEAPERYAMDADPPTMPGPDGTYTSSVPVPGVYKPY